MVFHMAQGCQRVGRFPGLADKNRDGLFGQNWRTITKLRRDIDLDRNARDLLEPVLRHMAGIMSGPTGDHDHSVGA